MKKQFVLICFLVTILIIKSQSLKLSNNVYLEKYSTMSYMGDAKDHHLYLSTKQGKRSYILIRFNKSDMKIFDKRNIEFNNKFEEIDNALLFKDTLYFSTIEYHRNEEAIYKYYKLNVYDLGIQTSDNKTIFTKEMIELYFLESRRNHNESENYIRYHSNNLRDNKNNNMIYSNDSFYTEHEEIIDTSKNNFSKVFTNVKIGITLTKKEMVLKLDPDKTIIRYHVYFNNNQFRIIGKYKSNSNKGSHFGLFYLLLNKNLNEIGKISYQKLFDGVKLSFNTKENNDLNILLTDFNTLEPYFSNSGEMTFIISNEFEKTFFSNDRFNSTLEGKGLNGLTILTFDNKSKILVNFIPLKQESYSFRNSIGYISSQNNDQLTLVFFEHKSNVIKPINDKNVKMLEFNNKGVLVKCTFDLDKKTISKKEIIATKKVYKQYFAFYYLFKNEKNAFYTIKPKWDQRNIYALKLFFE